MNRSYFLQEGSSYCRECIGLPTEDGTLLLGHGVRLPYHWQLHFSPAYYCPHCCFTVSHEPQLMLEHFSSSPPCKDYALEICGVREKEYERAPSSPPPFWLAKPFSCTLHEALELVALRGLRASGARTDADLYNFVTEVTFSVQPVKIVSLTYHIRSS